MHGGRSIGGVRECAWTELFAHASFSLLASTVGMMFSNERSFNKPFQCFVD
jgi:hypothetical protein